MRIKSRPPVRPKRHNNATKSGQGRRNLLHSSNECTRRPASLTSIISYTQRRPEARILSVESSCDRTLRTPVVTLIRYLECNYTTKWAGAVRGVCNLHETYVLVTAYCAGASRTRGDFDLEGEIFVHVCSALANAERSGNNRQE